MLKFKVKVSNDAGISKILYCTHFLLHETEKIGLGLVH